MVGTGRFELPTCRLGGGRSIHLSYVPIFFPTVYQRALSGRPAREAFLADVFTVLHAAELEFACGKVSVVNRGL